MCVPFSVCLLSLNAVSEIHPCCKYGWSVSCSLLSSIPLQRHTTVYAFLLIDSGPLTGGGLSVSQVLFQMTAWIENSHCFPSQPTLGMASLSNLSYSVGHVGPFHTPTSTLFL